MLKFLLSPILDKLDETNKRIDLLTENMIILQRCVFLLAEGIKNSNSKNDELIESMNGIIENIGIHGDDCDCQEFTEEDFGEIIN